MVSVLTIGHRWQGIPSTKGIYLFCKEHLNKLLIYTVKSSSQAISFVNTDLSSTVLETISIAIIGG
jgi:hypothetical protein